MKKPIEDPKPTESETTVASTSNKGSATGPHLYSITEDMLRKRIDHENKGRLISQLCCGLAASLAALSFGAVLGWSSSATRHLQILGRGYNFTVEDYGWIASLTPLGCSVGIMPWSYGITTVGPKHTMIFQTPFYILIMLIMTTLHSRPSYIVGRFFSGFLAIAYLMGGEHLLADSVHIGYLPSMTLCFRSFVLMGVLVSYIVGHFKTRFWLSATCAAIPLVNIFFLFLLPESPVFLYNKSEKKAEASLKWYRGRTNIYMALQSIKKDAEIRRIGAENRYMLYSKVVMKALLIVIGLNFFRVFSGYYAFVFYNVLLWHEFAIKFDEDTGVVLFGTCLFASNLVGHLLRFQVNFGVRKPLLLSCSLVASTLTILTIYTFLYEHDVTFSLANKWIPLAFINIFIASYEVGLGTCPDVILYDYLPFQVYLKAKNISQILYWFQVFLLIKYSNTVRNLAPYYVSFGLLSVTSYVSILYCHRFVIETKDKNLMQIQIQIGGNPIGNRGAYRYRREALHRHGIYIN